jgi:iron complex transport system ATP-binding protein
MNAGPSQVVLAMQGVTVNRGNKRILGPLDFRILSGERWVILGPNGAGKSTLLNILATRIFPTSGTVSILDKQMGKVDLSELRTRIGICASLLAEDIPDDEFVRDVVLTAAYAVIGRWNEVYDLWDESRAVALLTTFGVRDFADRRYYTLSDGEKKRVQIARALMADPELLLLDEPTSSIDVNGQRQIYELLKELNKKITIIVVSHDISVTLDYASKVAYINKKLTLHNSIKHKKFNTKSEHFCEVELMQHLGSFYF